MDLLIHKVVFNTPHTLLSVFRHPSYTGFFYWGIGLQIALLNPVCLVGYTAALYTFFSGRIKYEEQTLVDMFGNEYIEYRSKTYTFIPFIA